MDKGSPMFRSRSSSLASRKFSRKDDAEEPWDYVSFKKVPSTVNADSGAVQFTFDENNMPIKSENHKNGSHHNINYEVAKKQELEVIYEYVEPQNNNKRTLLIVVVLVLLICIGAGVGVALWQVGMFSSDGATDDKIFNQISNQNNVNSVNEKVNVIDGDRTLATLKPTTIPRIPESTTTLKARVTVKDTTKLSENRYPSSQPMQNNDITTTLPVSFQSTREATTETTLVTESVSPDLIVPTTAFNQPDINENLIVTHKKRGEDKMFMLLTGGVNNLENDEETGEVIGKRRPGRDEGCQKLESWAPHFTKFIGTTFLSTIDAIVSCGYTHIYPRMDDPNNNFDDYPMTSCFVYYKLWNEWQHVNVIEKVGFYEGAFFPWQNRLVLFGGNAIYGQSTHAVTRSICVFEFSAVKDLYGYHTDSEENDYYASGDDYRDDYLYDDSEDSYEGSATGSDEVEVKVHMIEDADHLLEEYGPGVTEGCAVTLINKMTSVSFIVTGGKSSGQRGSDGTTMRKAMKAHLKLDRNGLPSIGREHEFLPSMAFARKQHGCTKIFINGQDTMIVAGGTNELNNPVPEVEFLGLRRITHWKIFGTLKSPRFGFPTIGKISGKLVVVGGKNYKVTASDNLDIDTTNENIETNIEVYDERIHNFRSATDLDNLGKTSSDITSYSYYGVLFPKSWCHL